jgi:alanyl-tRNA synthetase
MTSSEIRQSFLDFFKEKQHAIVPSSSLLPDAPNLLFTNAGMNQFVPIFLGQAPCPYRPTRAADTQKCIRAGGKHNDLEDVGFDTYHHTFFEMLGNWSFGDYFKKEAIEWAWELVVNRWGFPPSRVYATIYSPGPGDPATLDQEAHEHWSEIFIQNKLDPAYHVVHGNKKDNFWMMGDTGPCGPCSELHIDLTPGPRDLDIPRQIAGRNLVNKGDARCIEIWNLVFIQFNANPDGTFTDLPARHVDTGMGFERVTSMIQGTKNFTDFENAKISNYETDVFRPLFDELEKITGKTYTSTLPASAQNLTEQEKTDVAFRVIADHIRTLSFSIADGIQPSNEGRGYVLRRILRRAVRYGRNLGLKEPFLGKLVDVLGQTMGHVFPEVVKKTDAIKNTLKQEEESFLKTLERGIELFEAAAGRVAVALRATGYKESAPDKDRRTECDGYPFPGADAFKLYDTYGFPLDLTELMARERGLSVDTAEFDRLMDEQKAKGKAAQKKEVITVEGTTEDTIKPTKFYGFDELQSVSLVVANESGALAVSETPFYAEMGGQVGDAGQIEIAGQKITVTNTVKSPSGKVYFHKLAEPVVAQPGDRVTLHVDEPRRAKIEGHHSGTHIMHWALRKVLSTTVSQKGSYVGPDRLRFDFSHGTAMTPDEIAEVEKLVNEKIAADLPVSWDERPYAQVKGDPSILQFFGDKYGETVRVVSIGDFSRELCGGTHVRHSNQIGYFKILHESAIAAGIRRIEAMSGEALRIHLNELLEKQDALVAAAGTAAATQPSLPALWDLYKSREKQLHDLELQRIQNEKEAGKKQEAEFQKRAATEAPEFIAAAREINGVPFLAKHVDAPAAYLPLLADALKTRWAGVAVLAAADTSAGKVALLAAVAPAHTKKIQAGKIIQTIAPLVGGKGGGRPELAQGGGTNPAGLPEALAKAETLL